MSEAPKRIGICPIHKTWHREPHETDWNYIRADLVEAAIKRALEVAAKKIATQRGTVYDDDSPEMIKWINGNNNGVSSALTIIRALDPAQFIKEKKE